MANWNTMHIFGYGESQMIGPDKNGKVPNNTLTTIAPLISYLASLQQEGTSISMDSLFTLNFFANYSVDFLPKDRDNNKRQRFMLADLDMSTINNFADELSNAIPLNQGETMKELLARIRSTDNVAQ